MIISECISSRAEVFSWLNNMDPILLGSGVLEGYAMGTTMCDLSTHFSAHKSGIGFRRWSDAGNAVLSF